MLKILNLRDEPAYLTTLAGWHQQEWAALNPGETLDMRISRMQTYLNNDFIPTTYIIKEKFLIGSAAITSNDMDSHAELSPWLASVFVAPEYRQMGIGKKLVLYVMQQARIKGIDKIYLYTPGNEDFYKNLGWITLNSEMYHGQQVAVMYSDLKNNT